MGKWLPVLLFLSLLAIAFAQARPGQMAEDVKSDLETKHEGPVQKPIGRGRKRRRLFGEEAEPGTGLKEKKRRRRNKKNGKNRPDISKSERRKKRRQRGKKVCGKKCRSRRGQQTPAPPVAA